MSMTMTVRTNPGTIAGANVSVIGVEVTNDGAPAPEVPVRITHVEGKECGTLTSAPTATDANGALVAEFTGRAHVQNCTARFELVIPGPTPEAALLAREYTTVTVHNGPPIARIDGLSAIALVLILSFAIDRIVRGLLFLLAYIPVWARAFPDPDLDDVVLSRRGEANRRLVYFVFSAALAIVVIGWFGEVRLLAALGFGRVNPMLDVLVTGLVLTAGADRTERILQSLGAGGTEAPAPKPTPIEITGKLTIDEQARRTLGV